ncbi:aminofutalosine synthase MqnE [Planctomicrobium sp. SH668]|uniref:aminofutalosine synthase MqnE n=1 Tax=Planctomicrobium sp. SH668 TaxID=3448126 RepID=UPI003F5BDAA8
MNLSIRDPQMRQIADRVYAGERLSYDDGLYLDQHADLMTLGALAHHVRQNRHGNVAYYNTNVHLNPTNVCVYRCTFCAFRSDLKAEKAYVFSDEMIRERVLEAKSRGATEIHVVGGLHHLRKFDWYVDVVRVIHETWPEIHIKAWTGVEISWFAHQTKKPYDWILQQMIDVGLGSLPGGGAEIFDPGVRAQICEHKADSQSWLDIHRAAHQLGLRSNATMLYGHVEKAEHRIDHLLKLRDLQDETGGFQTFIPLAFHPDNTRMTHIPKPTAAMDLRMTALSRLMLDNFDHIKAYWIMLGEQTAQVALNFGADDLDGTVVHELIYHDAGAKTPEGLTVSQIHHLIEEAGCKPVERDTLYRRVIRNGADWHVESAAPSAAAC